VLQAAAERNAGAAGAGSVGAVVGATITLPEGMTVDDLDIGGPLLVPGIGAQGGTVEDVRRVFGPAARHVLPSSSREILGEGPDKVALHDAVLRSVETFSTLT
jgi:orotidine-5'-phosphate decarboxylase